jgi:peptidoglycan hydrolase-like protein with peptidoglycan-binding domain
MTRPKRRRRSVGGVAIGAAVLAAVAGAAAAAPGIGLFHRESGTARDDSPPATTTVTRQTLVETEVKTGELGFGDTITLAARAGGTVTDLSPPNTVLQRGQVVYRVDTLPVVLLEGAQPAYRDLATGTEGADVKQFETNLYALGYRGFTVDDTYSTATATAVKAWQRKLGLDQTGTVELGRVLYAPGQIRIVNREATVGAAVQPGTAILTYSGTSPVVVAKLKVAEKQLASRGAAVEITLPDGKTTSGKVAVTETVVESDSDSDGGGGDDDSETRIKVSVTVDDAAALAGYDEAAVKVAFTAARRENVLTVPVAALLALAEGGYGVQVIEGTVSHVVPVQLGLFANGRVEITGEGLSEGATVGIPS